MWFSPVTVVLMPTHLHSIMLGMRLTFVLMKSLCIDIACYVLSAIVSVTVAILPARAR